MNRNAKVDSFNGQRVGIFADTYHMFSLGRLLNVKLDYNKLLPYLISERDVAIAKAYLLSREEDTMTTFKKSLQSSGWDVAMKLMEFKDFKKYNDQHEAEKSERSERNVINWDVDMSLDMWEWKDKLDTIILISGHGGFTDLIRRIKARGNIRVEIACFERFTNRQLFELADYFIELGPEKGNGNSYPEWLIPFNREAQPALVS